VNTIGPVTLQDVNLLATVLDWCQHNTHVRWLTQPHYLGISEQGTVRSIGDATGGFLRADEEIRTAYVRITLDSGFEWFAPVAEICGLIEANKMVGYR
jgi:hypothetical protein